jgi:hypothetical protein
MDWQDEVSYEDANGKYGINILDHWIVEPDFSAFDVEYDEECEDEKEDLQATVSLTTESEFLTYYKNLGVFIHCNNISIAAYSICDSNFKNFRLALLDSDDWRMEYIDDHIESLKSDFAHTSIIFMI